MPTFVLDTYFMSAHNKNDWKAVRCVMEAGVWGGGVHAHLCTSQVLTLKSSTEWKLQRTGSVLCGAGRGWALRNRCVDNYWGGTLVRARWAELSGDPYQQFGRRVPRLQEIQAITHSFPKQRVESRGQQQVDKLRVLCEVNVHIHRMYRHHDHLQRWVSGFQKVLGNKDVSFVSASESSILLRFWVKEILALKWSRGVGRGEGTPHPPLPPATVQLSCVPAQCVILWNASTAVCGCRAERRGMVGNEDRGWWSKRGPQWECSDGRRATESVGGVWVDATRRTRRGGDRRGVGGVLPAVSLQTVNRIFCIKEEFYGQLSKQLHVCAEGGGKKGAASGLITGCG